MIKSKFLKLMVLCFLVGFLSECKKGEDDPLISLRSRKARVVGKWTMKSGTLFYRSSSVNSSSVDNITLTGTAYVYSGSYTYNGVTTNSSNSGTFSYRIEFEKDGTFSMTQIADSDAYTVSGTWNFTGRIGDLKNKEQIILNVTSEISGGSIITYTGNKTTYTFNIKELRNKELVFYSLETTADSGDSDESREDYTFEQ